MSMGASLALGATGLSNIAEASGVAIALTGMTVVFIALALLSLFVALLPRALARLEKHFPEAMAGQDATVTVAAARGDEAAVVAAAVAAVTLHESGAGRD